MIVIQLIGRLGNCMFLFGTGLSLQALYPENEVFFYYSKSFPEDTKKVCEKYMQIFQNDFKLKFIEDPLPEMPSYRNLSEDEFFSLEEIPIQKNIFLCSFFQREKFLNKSICQERLRCPNHIKEEIFDYYGDISEFTSVHVRRGDYVNNGFFPCMDRDWYLKSMNFFEDRSFVITSDDIDWCKDNLSKENVTFADKETNNSEMLDMYIHSLCKDNIISASTFSWWGAYLNPNKNKKIYAPEKWFSEFAKKYLIEEMIKVPY